MPPRPRPEAAESARTIALVGREVPYLLRRSHRRTIGLTIDQRGLRVGAPVRASLGDIEGLIRKHGGWVLDKLDAWERRAAPAPLAIADGLHLPFLGGGLTVRLGVGANRALWSGDGCRLSLALAPGGDARAVLERALRERARRVFAERLVLLAPRLGVPQPPFALSSARTRWGSCSARGSLRLNWRLVFFPLPVIDYVVAHELAHLKEMNHGPAFWSLVERLCPDWRERRRDLKRLAHALPNF